MRQLRLRLPILPVLERSPEFGRARHPRDGTLCLRGRAPRLVRRALQRALDGIPRGSSVLRVNAVIIHARRLAAVIAAYRDALDRDARRVERDRHRTSF